MRRKEASRFVLGEDTGTPKIERMRERMRKREKQIRVAVRQCFRHEHYKSVRAEGIATVTELVSSRNVEKRTAEIRLHLSLLVGHGDQRGRHFPSVTGYSDLPKRLHPAWITRMVAAVPGSRHRRQYHPKVTTTRVHRTMEA